MKRALLCIHGEDKSEAGEGLQRRTEGPEYTCKLFDFLEIDTQLNLVLNIFIKVL